MPTVGIEKEGRDLKVFSLSKNRSNSEESVNALTVLLLNMSLRSSLPFLVVGLNLSKI